MEHVKPLLTDAFQQKNVLVTGACGFIGGHVVERLLELGANVTTLDRHVPAGIIERSGVRYIQCLLENAGDVIRLIRHASPDVIIHLAAQPDGAETHQQACMAISSNITGTVNVLEGMRQSGCQTLIFGDSTKDYGNCAVPYRESMADDPLGSYAISKSTAWKLCKLYQNLHGLNVISIRPTLIYGPGQPFNLFTYVTESVLSGKTEVRLMGGSQTRDPLYIDDAVMAYLLAATDAESVNGHAISIGGGHERTVESIAREMIRLMGSNIPVVIDEQEMRPTDMRRSYCDNHDAQVLLDWKPEVDLESGLQRTIEYISSMSITTVVKAG